MKNTVYTVFSFLHHGMYDTKILELVTFTYNYLRCIYSVIHVVLKRCYNLYLFKKHLCIQTL